jgi:thioesterase domain-containing protein
VDLVILLDTYLPNGVKRNWLKWLASMAAAMESPSAAWARVATRLRDRLGWSRARGELMQGVQNTGEAEAIRNAAFLHASKKWDAQRISSDFPVILFRGLDQSAWGPHIEFDADYGWRRYLGDRLRTFEISGNHLSILQPPHVVELADKVRPYLVSESGA